MLTMYLYIRYNDTIKKKIFCSLKLSFFNSVKLYLLLFPLTHAFFISCFSSSSLSAMEMGPSAKFPLSFMLSPSHFSYDPMASNFTTKLKKFQPISLVAELSHGSSSSFKLVIHTLHIHIYLHYIFGIQAFLIMQGLGNISFSMYLVSHSPPEYQLSL